MPMGHLICIWSAFKAWLSTFDAQVYLLPQIVWRRCVQNSDDPRRSSYCTWKRSSAKEVSSANHTILLLVSLLTLRPLLHYPRMGIKALSRGRRLKRSIWSRTTMAYRDWAYQSTGFDFVVNIGHGRFRFLSDCFYSVLNVIVC